MNNEKRKDTHCTKKRIGTPILFLLLPIKYLVFFVDFADRG